MRIKKEQSEGDGLLLIYIAFEQTMQLHCINHFHEARFFVCCIVFMQQTFGSCFVDDAYCVYASNGSCFFIAGCYCGFNCFNSGFQSGHCASVSQVTNVSDLGTFSCGFDVSQDSHLLQIIKQRENRTWFPRNLLYVKFALKFQHAIF